MPTRLALLAVLAGVVSALSVDAQRAPDAWPQFRGPDAAGVATGQNLPERWDAASGDHIAWKTAIPGLAHSSPIVWANTLFVTTAVSTDPDATFTPGLYGAGTASEDRSAHRFMLMAIDRHTGAVRWERVAYEGPPSQKRHIKSTYASATPATNGRVVLAFFGSMGLYAFDMAGEPLWSADFGRIDAGAYDLPEYEWGTASSPILWNDLAIVQVDHHGQSFVVALDAATGEERWRTDRDELPSWGTPTVVETPGRDAELVTNASNLIRGYDPRTGRELWRLGGSSLITAPTPIFTDDFIVVASGRRDEKPIFVLRPGARGDITLAEGDDANEAVVWHKRGRGPYMPTPLIYGDRLYVLGNDGIFDAYALATGEEIYRQRIPHVGSGFSASPVAADGRIYLSSEDGDIFVVSAGDFELLATNPMHEPLMATPAMVDGMLYVRGQHHVFAIGQ